jgi:hypothetical protein
MSGRTVVQVQLRVLAENVEVQKARSIPGCPCVGKTVLAFALALEFAAAPSWAVSWLSFWGPLR